MAFLYSAFLKLLYPTSLSLVLLLVATLWHKRKIVHRTCLWLAVSVLLICGNGWVVGGLIRGLERQYPPLQLSAFSPQPSTDLHADAILVLSGGIDRKLPPRSTVEVGEAGDRMLYGARLYHEGLAPVVICTGGGTNLNPALQPLANAMAEFLETQGVPETDLILEGGSGNTHEHAVNLKPVFAKHQLHRVLLVTSAMHIPRSMGVFHKICPDTEFIAAPTDYRVVEGPPTPWYQHLMAIIPTPRHLLDFSEAMHEYLGMAYYWMRGWI